MMADRTEGDLLKTFARKLATLEKRQSFRLPARLASEATLLGTVDLDTIDWSGWGVQVSNANATLARHYPIAGRAGTLFSIASPGTSSSFRMQRYVDYQNQRAWVRTQYAGVWADWREELGIASGPVAVTLEPGFTGSLTIEALGREVSLRGTVTGSFTANVTTLIAAIPGAYLPISPHPMPAIWTNGEYNWGSISNLGAYSVRKTTTGSSTLSVGGKWQRNI